MTGKTVQKLLERETPVVASVNEQEKKTPILIGSEQMHADKMTQQRSVVSYGLQTG